MLSHLVVFDQLNVGKLAGCESISRHVMQIHAAVKRNPRNPNFRGMEMMVSSTLDSKGGVVTGDFANWTAEQQKQQAFTMKQQRLYAEEEDLMGKRNAQQPGNPNKKK